MTDVGSGLDDNTIGFNLGTQKLHCLIVMDDEIGAALSDKAGEAFFRAFIVEDRKTGEVFTNMRFRYTTEDSWMRLNVTKDRQNLSKKEKIEFLGDAVENVMRIGMGALAGTLAPTEAMMRLYPPNPDDAQATFDWLIAEDLVKIVFIGKDPVA